MKWFFATLVPMACCVVALAVARTQSWPEWFGDDLTRAQVVSLVAQLAPSFDGWRAAGPIRGVSVNDVWDGWDRWGFLQLGSAEDVDLLKRAVIERGNDIAERKRRGSEAGAVVRNDARWRADSTSSPPRWWCTRALPDADRVPITYGAGDHDVWVFSRVQRKVYFRCTR